jgi:3-dehydroquinate synthase
MTTTRIEVAAHAGTYPVIIASGLLATLPDHLTRAGLGPRRFVVTSPLVSSLHGPLLTALGTEREPILVSDGERSKTLQTVSRVYEALIQAGADRSAVVIAAGGGVIGDLVGFAAATYLRGVRLVQVPTTLLAQVDSAIGGKVGVNHPLGKNLVGAFHAPSLVAIDPEMLVTLPRREFRAGMYEVVKYGVIASEAILADIESHRAAIFARHPDALHRIVAASCTVKGQVVSADERESSVRRTLNFGHTIGHALESVTRYRRFRHGEAVAYGMLGALGLGVARGITPPEVRDRIRALLTMLGPLPPVSDLSVKELLSAITRDKKVVAGTLHFVASTGVGQTTTLTDVTTRELRAVLKELGVRNA